MEGEDLDLSDPAPEDARWMRRALRLARRGLGSTCPNPAVGAVLVRGDSVVGEGCHERAGEAHAEVRALAGAGGDAAGATLYVTLEPCSTTGRTPPCTEAIRRAGVARVVCGVIDPNPRHAGRGLEILRRAGIAVTLGVESEKAAELIRGFAWWVRTGRPWVVAKAAMSLDGRIATPGGSSKWITGEKARRRGHRERAWVDAVAIGAETLRRDDPSLDCRLPGKRRRPVRIVLTGGRDLPTDRKLFSDSVGTETIVAVARDPLPEIGRLLRERGVEILRLPAGPDGVDIDALLEELGRREITSLLLEGGGRLLGSFFRAGRVNEALFFYAPIVMGEGRPAVAGVLAKGDPAEAPRMTVVERKRFGDDGLIRGRFPCSPGSSKKWAWWME